jgi:hypothetical protein
MNLEGIEVKHKVFGKGIVKQQDKNYILIAFSQGEKRFLYPDAFKTFITPVDDKIADNIQKEIEQLEAKASAEKREQLFAAVRASDAYHKPQNAAITKVEIPQIRPNASGRQYFFVFQNKSFDAERRGGYLWAPKFDQNGRKISHWTMMEKVHKGDVIFHSVSKGIRAISLALSDCYSAHQPEELKQERIWEDDGYRVDCQYIDIQNPIITSDYMDTILKLQPDKYAPFNHLGRGNTGYLFASNKRLSQFLLDKVIASNPYLADIANIIE